MIDNKKILVVVPARGGSKGIKLKNIRSVNGVPLVAITGQIVKQLDIIDRAIVSTDHKEIAKVAKENGLTVPFLRPKYISGDHIGDLEVLEHALIEMERQDNTMYDIVVMLQPTSPSRTAKHVSDAINKLIETNADSVWALSLTDSKAHPYKQLTIHNDEIDYYDKEGANIIARQQLTPTYHKNGIAYAITRDCILNQKNIKGKKCVPLLIDEYVSNIDTELDIAFAEFLITYNKNNNRSI